MPLYEYECTSCGHRFEKIESLSASPRQKCPKCRGRAERMLAAPAIQFKGSGWYVTDYAGKSGQDLAAEKTETANAKESKDSKDSKATGEAKEKKEAPPAGQAKKPHKRK